MEKQQKSVEMEWIDEKAHVYLLASLFNAGSTISGYYRNEVNHDMPQYV